MRSISSGDSDLFRFFFVATFLVLSSCETANVSVGGALTSQGYVNRSEIGLGEVYLWDRITNTSRRVNFVEPSPNLLTQPSPKRTLDVSFTQGVEFAGGVDGLTEDQVIGLVNEVKSRSSIKSTEVSSVGFRDPLDAILEEIRADRERWYRSLEVTDDLTLPEGLVLVMVSGVTSGKSLAVEVDRQIAADATFASRTISTASGELQFRVTNTNQVNISSSDPDGAILFATLLPYTLSEGPNGISFQLVRDTESLLQLADVLASGL